MSLNWLRQLLVPPAPQGTVTLFDDGMMVGLSRDLTKEQVHLLAEKLRDWQARGYPPELLIFPFPVEMTDARTKR